MPLVYKSINVSSSGDNTIITGVAGHNYRVLNYTVVANGTVTVKFKSGSTDVTGAMPLVVNSGVSATGTRDAPLWESVALGDSVILNLGGAVAVLGHMTVLDQVV